MARARSVDGCAAGAPGAPGSGVHPQRRRATIGGATHGVASALSERAIRTIDVAIGTAMLLLATPVMLAVAVAVVVDSRGAPIHREQRLGRAGRVLTVLKFRTLRRHAGAGPRIAPVGDPRVTRLGGILRRSHLDELPQLVQVLAGAMSLVGPRPARAELWAAVPADLRRRALAHRPGMTSPASLRFICEDDVLAAADDPESLYREVILPAKVADDVRYLDRRSPAGDLRVLLATVTTLPSRRARATCRRRLAQLGAGPGTAAPRAPRSATGADDCAA